MAVSAAVVVADAAVVFTATSAVRGTASPAASLPVNRAVLAASTVITDAVAAAMVAAEIIGAADAPRAAPRQAVKPCQPPRFESHKKASTPGGRLLHG